MPLLKYASVKTVLIVLPILMAFYLLQSSLFPPLSTDISNRIKQKTTTVQALRKLRLSGEGLQNPDLVKKMYKSNSYSPFWFKYETALSQSTIFLLAINGAYKDGLDPNSYHPTVISEWIQSLARGIGAENADSLALFDILMTDAFVTYSTHQYAGAVYGDGMNVSREAHLKKISLKDSLNSAIANNRMVPALLNFVNTTPPYLKLKQYLQFYRRISAKDGFANIPEFDADSVNRGEVLSKLCAHLSLIGELPSGYKATTYSPFVEVAVKHFQYSHGLDTSGRLTRETIAQLNIPLQERIRQIELNMERCRWLPREQKDVFVQVNIPGFFMEVKEQYKTVLHMRAIVGKDFTQTPLFYATMAHVVINPYWDVPQSIATKEILPILKRDPGYISRNHMELHSSSGGKINPYDVSWGNYSENYFPFKIRQIPGDWNALGRIKFLFPNPYNVYLHGTPNQELFEKPVRAFSHGCMRLEDPVRFATYLLKNQSPWNEDFIRSTIKKGDETWIKLARQYPVFVTYATCWVDDDNILHFRNDVYGHDNRLARELFGSGDKLPLNIAVR